MNLSSYCTPSKLCHEKHKRKQPPIYENKVDPKILEERCYNHLVFTFPDRVSPTKSNEKIKQITQPPMSYRSYPNGHKTNDPQVRWSRNNIAMTMEYFEPISSTSTPVKQSPSQTDYSYAYYEPGAAMRHSNIPTSDGLSGPSTLSSPKSIRALLAKPEDNVNKSKQNSRHAYTTRYGTQENIYEDVSAIGSRPCSQSSVRSLNEQVCSKSEFQHILQNHYRVLEELNLSVEELLLSTTTKTNILSARKVSKHTSSKSRTNGKNSKLLHQKSNVQTSMNELVAGEDSGFSGSSSGASYIGSLRNYKTALTRSLFKSSRGDYAKR